MIFAAVYLIILYGLVISPLTMGLRRWAALRFMSMGPYCPTCVGTYIAVAITLLQWYLEGTATIGVYLVAGTILLQYYQRFSAPRAEIEWIDGELSEKLDRIAKDQMHE